MVVVGGLLAGLIGERVGGWREAENYEEKERVLEESEEAREKNERK